MLMTDFLKRMLFSKKAGTTVKIIAWLSMIGVAIGVTALVVIMSIMNGFNGNIKNKLLALEPNLIIPNYKSTEPAELLLKKYHAEVAKYEVQDVIIKTSDGLFGGAIAKGMQPEAYQNMLTKLKSVLKKEKKLRLETMDYSLSKGEVVVGKDLANSLNIYEGDQLVLAPPETLILPVGEIPVYEKVTVKAIIDTEVGDFDSKYIFYILGQSLMQFKNQPSVESGIEVVLNKTNDTDSLSADLKELKIKNQTWVDRNGALFFALRMEKIIMTLFLSLSVLITGFSLITVIILLMTQKRKDIGMLLAMGLNTKEIKKIFVGVGVFLSAIGGTVGLGLGVFISLFIDKLPLDLLPDIYYETKIPAQVDYGVVFLIFIFIFAISLIGSYIPVIKTLKYSPAEALRLQR